MPAITGQPITPAVLAETWDSVVSVKAHTSEMYEVTTHTINFDKVHSDLSNSIHYWTPSTDAQVLAITYTTQDGSHVGTMTIQISGNINYSGETAAITVAGTTNTRDNIFTVPFGVLAGDTIQFQITAVDHVGTGPNIARIHILYKHRWSRL